MDYRNHLALALSMVASSTYNDVGCLILGVDNRLLVSATSGIPYKLDSTPDRYLRPLKYVYVEHAERAAIYQAASRGFCLMDTTMVVTAPPCDTCALAIIATGIGRVVWLENHTMDMQRWGERIRLGHSMLKEAGLILCETRL